MKLAVTKPGRYDLVDVRRLEPHDRNPRTITTERFGALMATLLAQPGLLEARPLIALPDGRVVAGNMRQRACDALADDARFLERWPGAKVPTVVRDLDPDTATKWMLLDNNPFGDWEEQALAELLYGLEQRQAGIGETGFTSKRLTQLLDSVAGPKVPGGTMPDDPAPDPPKRPRSKPGAVYDLGPHRIMCGDSTNPDDVARLLEGETPTLMVTDPPYGVELDMTWRRGEQRRPGGKVKTTTPGTYTGMEGDTRADWADAFALVSSLTVVYVWHADRGMLDVLTGLDRIGFAFAQMIVWDKLAFALSRSRYQFQHEAAIYAARVGAEVPWYGPSHAAGVFARKPGSAWLGSADQSTIWAAPSPKRRSSAARPEDEPVDHPTQKPTLLYTRPYSNHTERGDAVYEPFSGSGTALIAAEMIGRRCYAMELDPRFVDVSRQRYAEYTGREW